MGARQCQTCGGPMPTPKVGRPRLNCEKCAPPRLGMSKPTPPVSVTEIRPGAGGSATLVEATEASLREIGRLSDPRGIVAVELAKSIEAGGHSGASLASLSREFRAAFAEALVPAEDADAVEDDGVSWDVG